MSTNPAPRLLMLDDNREPAAMTAEYLGLVGFALRLAHAPTRIFEPFYRVDAPRPAGDTGTGLGLAIAARVIRAHGGTIAASIAAPGLRVTLSL